MGVSKNRGTPKWMVYNGKLLLKWMIWGSPYFWKHPYGHAISSDATSPCESTYHPFNNAEVPLRFPPNTRVVQRRQELTKPPHWMGDKHICGHVSCTTPKFNSEFSPEKWPKPNRKGGSFFTSTIFQGRAVKLQGCNQLVVENHYRLTVQDSKGLKFFRKCQLPPAFSLEDSGVSGIYIGYFYKTAI